MIEASRFVSLFEIKRDCLRDWGITCAHSVDNLYHMHHYYHASIATGDNNIMAKCFIIYSSTTGTSKVVINPRRMRDGYGSRSVCVCLSVCLSVCYHANCYIPRLRVQISML